MLGCGCGGLSGFLSRFSGNFGGIFLLNFVLLSLLSCFLLEMLKLADLLFDRVHLLVSFVFGMGGSLSSLLLNLGGLGSVRLSVALFALLAHLAMAFLFVLLLQDRLLGLVLCLLDGVCLRVLSVDQLIMLGLSSLLSLCLCDLGLLLLLLKLFDALFHFSVMLLRDLFIVDLLFLANLGLLPLDVLDMLLVSHIIHIICSGLLGLLVDSLGGLLVGAAAATEFLTHVPNDGVMVAGEGLSIDTMEVLVGDLILELGLDLGTDTLHDLACGDLLVAAGA